MPDIQPQDGGDEPPNAYTMAPNQTILYKGEPYIRITPNADGLSPAQTDHLTRLFTSVLNILDAVGAD